MAETAQTPILIGVEETAAMLGTPVSTLRWMVHRGTAPRSAIIGGRRRWKTSEVVDWVDAQLTADEQKRSA